MVTRCGGLTPDPRFAALELLLLLLNEDPTVKGFPIRDEVIDDARQFVRHGRDRLRSAQFGPRARKQSPSGDWLFSSELAAIRNAPATRFRLFAITEAFTGWPDTRDLNGRT